MKGRTQASNVLKAITASTICLVCGLFIGYQARSIRQQSTKINLRLSKQGTSQALVPQISTEHIRHQYRYLQPPERASISMHTIVPTGCDRWQDFQMAGLYWSFLRCATCHP